MKVIISLAISILSLFSSIQAMPLQTDISFAKSISWAGTGCETDSFTNKNIYSNLFNISFDSFAIGTLFFNDRKRASCAFSIPLKINHGYQLTHISADWQGLIKGKGELARKYYISGNPYTSWKKNTARNDESREKLFQMHDNFNLITNCNGGSYILNINSYIRTLTKGKVDSFGTKLNSVKFLLHFKRCTLPK